MPHIIAINFAGLLNLFPHHIWNRGFQKLELTFSFTTEPLTWSFYGSEV